MQAQDGLHPSLCPSYMPLTCRIRPRPLPASPSSPTLGSGSAVPRASVMRWLAASAWPVGAVGVDLQQDGDAVPGPAGDLGHRDLAAQPFCHAAVVAAARGVMAVFIPARLRDEDFATSLVRRYLAAGTAGRARYSGAHFERIGEGGDRPEVSCTFTAEDLLAVTMLSVRIEGYHALEILYYRARELNELLSQIPPGIGLQDPGAAAHIARGGPAWRLWDAICDIEPRP